MTAELLAEQDGAVFQPVTLDGVTWETHRVSSPGTLVFTVLEEDGGPCLREGARITLRLDGEALFCGYVFTRARTAGGRSARRPPPMKREQTGKILGLALP